MRFLGFKLVQLGLVYKKTLIVGDIHLGYEDNLIKEGVLIPKHQLLDLKEELSQIHKKTKFNRVILNGDIKHEFGRISDQERKDIVELIDFLRKFGEVIVNKGNHDKILLPILQKVGLDYQDYYRIENILITHGHKKLKREKDEILVLSHDHPAITLQDQNRKESFKCFLIDKKKRIVVIPSIHSVTTGTDILTEKPLSPFFRSFNSFEVYVPKDKEILFFGKVKDIKKKY